MFYLTGHWCKPGRWSRDEIPMSRSRYWLNSLPWCLQHFFLLLGEPALAKCPSSPRICMRSAISKAHSVAWVLSAFFSHLQPSLKISNQQKCEINEMESAWGLSPFPRMLLFDFMKSSAHSWKSRSFGAQRWFSYCYDSEPLSASVSLLSNERKQNLFGFLWGMREIRKRLEP